MRIDKLTTKLQSALADAQSLALGKEHIIEAKTGLTGEDFCLQMLFSQSDYVLCSIGTETMCSPLRRLFTAWPIT